MRGVFVWEEAGERVAHTEISRRIMIDFLGSDQPTRIPQPFKNVPHFGYTVQPRFKATSLELTATSSLPIELLFFGPSIRFRRGVL